MDLQNGARQEENDYETFNPPPKPRSVMRVHFNTETSQTLLKRHQAEADAAYRKNDISLVLTHSTSIIKSREMIIFIKQKKSIKTEDNF
jgi:hypothetical protein